MEVLAIKTTELYECLFHKPFTAKDLYPHDTFSAFYDCVYSLDRIIRNSEWVNREEAENSNEYKQIIPYGIIINSDANAVLRYKRESKTGEQALNNKYSFGIGGHIEKCDLHNVNYKQGIVDRCMMREVKEELNLNTDSLPYCKLAGIIDYNKNEVGKKHLGIVMDLQLTSDIELTNTEEGIGDVEFVKNV